MEPAADTRESWDCIVVGAGHAGCEAAAAAARMGRRTLLLTLSLDALAHLSCNPAVGGVAKGHVVLEVDALGGLMGEVADASAIQYRLLNRGKGPAVRAPRAQCDRERYRLEMRRALENVPGLHIRQAHVTGLLADENGAAAGVITSTGLRFRARSVVLCTGTFLDGLIHLGDISFPGGRAGEPAAVGLTEACERLGLKHGRLKTGTPPRVWGWSLDLSRMTEQPPDERPFFFSRRTTAQALPSRSCYLTRTNPRTHEILRSAFDRAPLFTGRITGEGPRYCPSIELKLVRFADRDGHQLYLEPEGLHTSEYYVNGFATSLPEEVQEEALRTVPGMENAVLSRPGYAIEYDYFEPVHLRHTLESRVVPRLFFAGQVNGTSGYEEAAGQGIIAGINAALAASGSDERFVLDRAEAYIGVMVDDLVTRGVGEPYRLFTSRAEYRLLLRTDNVYRRLMPYARKFGLVSDADYIEMERLWLTADELRSMLASRFEDGVPLLRLLRRPGVTAAEVLARHPALKGRSFDERVLASLETEAKYEGYIARQLAEVERFRKNERLALPEDTDYFAIEELRYESREKLAAVRPASIGQAGRIPGVTPADLSVLLVLRKAGKLPRLGRKP